MVEPSKYDSGSDLYDNRGRRGINSDLLPSGRHVPRHSECCPLNLVARGDHLLHDQRRHPGNQWFYWLRHWHSLHQYGLSSDQ